MKWLIGLLVLLAVIGILAPLAVRAIQNRDFRRQIEGKRPMREADAATAARQDAPPDSALEAEAARMNVSNGLNLMGPK